MSSRRPPAWQAKRLLEWTKGVLVHLLVRENDLVCDLWCGPGSNTARFAAAKSQFYLGLDPFDQCLSQAKQHWEDGGSGEMDADFRRLDPVTGDYGDVFDGVGAQLGEFDLVSCFGKLQLAWGSEEVANRFLYNVSSVLRPGGLLCGFMPDSEAIWNLCHKRSFGDEAPQAKKELFSIQFHSAHADQGGRQPVFGARYNLQIDDGKGPQQFYLVHMHTLMKLAATHGLEMVEMVNATQYYEDNKLHWQGLLKEYSVVKDPSQRSHISDKTMELAALFTTFVFRKVQ